MKVVHRNLLLPLFSNPLDQTSDLDNKAMVDQTVSIQVVIAAGAVASHVHNLSTYGRVQGSKHVSKRIGVCYSSVGIMKIL